jgi:hypothetical protein
MEDCVGAAARNIIGTGIAQVDIKVPVHPNVSGFSGNPRHSQETLSLTEVLVPARLQTRLRLDALSLDSLQEPITSTTRFGPRQELWMSSIDTGDL